MNTGSTVSSYCLYIEQSVNKDHMHQDIESGNPSTSNMMFYADLACPFYLPSTNGKDNREAYVSIIHIASYPGPVPCYFLDSPSLLCIPLVPRSN